MEQLIRERVITCIRKCFIIELCVIIIIIKTSSTDPSGKNKVIYKLLAAPQAPALRETEENTTQ